MSSRRLRAPLVLLLALTLAANGLSFPLPAGLLPPTVKAQDAVVAVCDEEGFDTALDAVQLSGGGTITFSCSGTITFTAQKTITTNVAIRGGGVVTLSGGNTTRLFRVADGASLSLDGLEIRGGRVVGGHGAAVLVEGQLSVTNSTLTDNHLPDGSSTYGGGAIAILATGAAEIRSSELTNNTAASLGGAIYNQGDLTIIASRLSGNRANSGGAISTSGTMSIMVSELTGNEAASQFGGGGQGGAIQASGTYTIRASTISGNVSNEEGIGHAGAIWHAGHGEIIDSTIADNHAGENGGAIYSFAGFEQTTLTISNSTITGNSGKESGGIEGYGDVTIIASTIVNNATTQIFGATVRPVGGNPIPADFRIQSTIIANNSGGDCQNRTLITSGGSNLGTQASAFSCNFTEDDVGATTIALGSLTDNGGPTQTIAPLPGSAAIDAGNCAHFPNYDQRGAQRPSSGCDIGAVEVGATVAPQLLAVSGNGFEGSPVTVTAFASGPTSAAFTYAFDCDNNGSYETSGTGSGTTGTGPCTFDDNGEFIVGAQVSIGAATAVFSGTVKIVNAPPAITSITPSGPLTEGTPTTFTVDASDPGVNDQLEYEFDCHNDGHFEIGPQSSNAAECTPTAPGGGSIAVRVSDDDGGSALQVATYTVANADPTITSIDVSGNPVEGAPQTVTVSATDPGGTDGFSYEFDCHNDGTFEIGPQTGNSATCTYSDNGSYTIGVRVNDGEGGSATDTREITIANVDPSVGPISIQPSPSDEGETVTASATFSDPGSDDTHTCTVDYGDGSGPQTGTVDQEARTCTGPSHTYVDDPSGTATAFTVTVTVTDNDDGVGSGTQAHIVNNLPPMITGISDDGPIDEGGTVTLTVSASDPGVDDQLTYSFDCDNDGQYETASNGNQGSCSFSNEGTYTIGVRVADDDGGIDTETHDVTVLNAAPILETPEVFPEPSNEGNSVTVVVSFSDAGSQDTHTCTIDYGDGTDPATGVVNQEAGTCTSQHTYLDDADDPYTIEVTITDDAGASNSISADHTVENLPPEIERVETNSPVAPGQPVMITVTATDPGVYDILTYRFDCQGGDDYETPGTGDAGNEGVCVLDPGLATATINVLVEDGDGGSDTQSMTVSQVESLCASSPTGLLRAPLVNGNCPPATTPLALPGATSTTLCIHRPTGDLIWAPRANCSPGHDAHIVPDDGPLAYCEHVYTGKLRYTSNGTCVPVERYGVIPGAN